MLKKINMKKGTAVLLVVILVMALLVLGVAAAYQFGVIGKQKSDISQSVVPPAQDTQADVQDRSGEITKVGSGDKISNIEDDLNKTDINSIDKDVMGIKTQAQGL